MLNDQLPIQKIIIAGVSLLVFVLFALWLVKYLTTGVIAVSTSKASDIVSVRPVNLPPGGTATKSAPHDITVRIKPGAYVVSVSSNNSSSSRIVTVKAGHKSIYILNPIKTLLMEPVLPKGATSLAANSSSLVYVDPVTKNIMTVNGSGGPQKASPLVMRQASLTTPGLGVAQDEYGTLYQVANGNVTPLDTMGHTPNSSLSNISLSGSGLLAFTSGDTVYAGQIGTIYKAIYQSEESGTKVFAGNNKVAIIEKPTRSGEAEGENKVTVISTSGQKIEKEIDALQMEWSPSGKYVFVAEEDGNFIYDSSLNLVRTLDSNGLGVATWVNDNSLAYNSGKFLWLYDLANSQANQISRAPDGISFISTTPDASYVYVVNGPASKGGASAIARVGLKGQLVPGYVRTLGIFLPDNAGVCSISYVNLAQPTITVSYPASTTTPDFCINAAKGKLTYYDVNSSKFQYQATPVTTR